MPQDIRSKQQIEITFDGICEITKPAMVTHHPTILAIPRRTNGSKGIEENMQKSSKAILIFQGYWNRFRF